jgi:hypothetical protein
LSGRFLDPSQAAPGDDDLATALGGEHAGCRISEPGGGAGDESDGMSHRLTHGLFSLSILNSLVIIYGVKATVKEF